MNQPSISIIMRSKNDAWVIEDTLTMLFKQTITDFELLHVDSGSTDGTVDIIKRFSGTLYQIKPEAYIPGVVLNDMVSKAKGDIIVFLNSDGTPKNEYWLETLIKPLVQNPKPSVVFSRQFARPDAWKLIEFDYMRTFPSKRAAWLNPDFLSFVSTAFHKEIWQQHPFYTLGISEDQQWANRLIREGIAIHYVPESEVYHSHNYTWRQLWWRQYWSGASEVYILNTHWTWYFCLYRILKEIVRDLVYSLPRLHGHSLWFTFPYRIIFNYAFYKGIKEGHRRKKENSVSYDPALYT